MITQSLFFPGNRETFKKNREAIDERAITERDDLDDFAKSK